MFRESLYPPKCFSIYNVNAERALLLNFEGEWDLRDEEDDAGKVKGELQFHSPPSGWGDVLRKELLFLKIHLNF